MDNPEPVVIAVRHPGLYTATRATVQQMLMLLRQALPDPPRWPTRQGQKIIFQENGSGTEATIEDAPRDSLGQIYEALQRTDAYQEAVRQLNDLAAEGKALPHFFGVGKAFVDPILAEYLDMQRNLEFDERSFGEAYDGVEGYIFASSAKIRLHLSLRGLRGTADDVQLSQSHAIRRLGADEINRLWRIESPPGMPTQLVYRIGPNIWPELWRFGAIETVKPGTYAYEFTPKLADSVKGHWQEAVRVASHLQQPDEKLSRPMRIAAFRFCSSFDKESPEDQLIDYSIALEALFTKENDAISYRLPLRAAIFVGDTPEEREKIFWTVKGSYDLRSDLAHGQSQLDQTIKVKNTKVDISEFMSDLRAIQFKALHRFSKASQKLSKENILRAIDTVAISLDRQPIERLYCPSRHDAQT